MLGRTAGSASSIGRRNDITNVVPGASEASCCSVAVIASFVRYMLTPIEVMSAGFFGSNPAATRRSSHVSPRSKSTGTK